MKYQPSRHVSMIFERRDDYKPIPGGPRLFDTWQEAHRWMINDRIQKWEMAKELVQLAESNYQCVLAMKLEGSI
jgi:hypothetical protein